MDIDKTKEQLETLRSIYTAKVKALEEARLAHEKAYGEFSQVKKEIEHLDYQLALADGRLKQIKAGRSAKKKARGGEPKLDLTAYVKSLSGSAREQFIEQLLSI